MLSIGDDEVRALATAVMKERGAPTLTEAIKLALRNELDRADGLPSLKDRINALREVALSKVANTPDRSGPDARDTLWER